MVFTNWVLYSSLFFFVAYMGSIALEKGKKYIGKGKLLDQIEDKYDSLRVARREMIVIHFTQFLLATLLLGIVLRRAIEGGFNGEGDLPSRGLDR